MDETVTTPFERALLLNRTANALESIQEAMRGLETDYRAVEILERCDSDLWEYIDNELGNDGQ